VGRNPPTPNHPLHPVRRNPHVGVERGFPPLFFPLWFFFWIGRGEDGFLSELVLGLLALSFIQIQPTCCPHAYKKRFPPCYEFSFNLLMVADPSSRQFDSFCVVPATDFFPFPFSLFLFFHNTPGDVATLYAVTVWTSPTTVISWLSLSDHRSGLVDLLPSANFENLLPFFPLNISWVGTDPPPVLRVCSNTPPK